MRSPYSITVRQFPDTGHFAIETHVVEIAAAMKDFLAANAAYACGGGVIGAVREERVKSLVYVAAFCSSGCGNAEPTGIL